MKATIHPDYIATKVTCSGCGTTFDSHSTVETMQVDVCSNCHPFYTGKQKLVDTAGRVDRFKAKSEAAAKRKEALAKKSQKALSRNANLEGSEVKTNAKPQKSPDTTPKVEKKAKQPVATPQNDQKDPSESKDSPESAEA